MQHKYVSKLKCNEHDVVRKSNHIQQQTNSTTDVQLVYAVYDDKTGKMMEMRELRNHPNKKKREEWDKLSANEYGRLMKRIGMKRKRKIEYKDSILSTSYKRTKYQKKKSYIYQILLQYKTRKRGEKQNKDDSRR